MKKQSQNIDIQCWEHTGSRLGKHRPFLCLQGERGACESLLTALDELAVENMPSRRTLSLKPCQRLKACSTIQLLLSPVSAELQEMSLSRVQDTARFEFSPVGLPVFRAAVATWRNGGEDFCVCPDRESGGKCDKESGEVWFWTPFTDA
jgi:hypothetical protein